MFNHNGSTSRYFNADGFYPELGAAQSKDSPYYPWYRFTHWPDGYDAWWGVHTLPAVNEECPSYREFIVDGEDSVVRHWLRLGASGWRLDVADELPDDFIADIRAGDGTGKSRTASSSARSGRTAATRSPTAAVGATSSGARRTG